MIDLVRLYSVAKQRDMVKCIEENQFSTSFSHADLISERLTYPIIGINNGITFKATPNKAYVFGSLHKHYNMNTGRDDQNYNDFYYSDLSNTIDEFLEKYPLLSDFQITRLEIGFNLDLNELGIEGSVKDLINDCFHFYDWNVLPTESKYANDGYMREFKRTQYSFKVYDKSTQYKLDEKRILRIELKMIKKKEFADLGIYNLVHLKNKEAIQGLWKLFKERFKSLMIVDPVRPDKRSQWKDELFNFLSPGYWRLFTRGQKETKARHIKKALNLFEEKGLLSIKEKLRNGLEAKYLQLLEGEDELNVIGTDSTYTSSGISHMAAEDEFEKGGDYEC